MCCKVCSMSICTCRFVVDQMLGVLGKVRGRLNSEPATGILATMFESGRLALTSGALHSGNGQRYNGQRNMGLL